MDIITRLYDMPTDIRSFVRHNPDDTYTIVINSRLNIESRRKRYIHELRHIRRGDFDREETADRIEKRAHKEDNP